MGHSRIQSHAFSSQAPPCASPALRRHGRSDRRPTQVGLHVSTPASSWGPQKKEVLLHTKAKIKIRSNLEIPYTHTTKRRNCTRISLLSCLGKGLERLIARRLAWTCVSHGVLNPQQAGALPKRSAVDLVASLVHDIEVALSQQKVATLVTMDIQGAFDTVMRNRLILRLRQQGWPTALVKWVASFMQDRAASIRYQDITTPSTTMRLASRVTRIPNTLPAIY